MTKKTITKQILRVYWQHARKYKKQILTIYPLIVVAQVVEDFIQPLIISFVLTNIAANNIDVLRSSNLPLILFGVFITEAIGHLLWSAVIVPIFWHTQDRIMRDLSMTAFDHIQTMSANFFSNKFAGSLVNQVNKFVSSFERLTDALTFNIFKLLISIVATTIILFPKAPMIAIAIIIISGLYAPLVWFYRKRQLPYNKAWAEAETARTGQLADSLSNVMAVKSFSGDALERSLMQKKVNDVHNRSIDTMLVNRKQELITGALQRSINVSVVVIAVYLAVNQKILVGLIYLSLTFTIAIMRRLWDLNNTFRAFTRVFGDAAEMTEILQIQPEITDPVKPEEPAIIRGAIRFDNVTFKYPGNDRALFEDLDIRIRPGEKIGLVGHSGGGKTTITQLLLRFMDIQKGTITIDNQDITKITQNDLRSRITYVAQEPLLFHRSLRDNIAYGDKDADQKTIEAVAKMAHAEEFIKRLPEGYDTLVGERGVKLSGGQRQRVAIARAMIKNAPILVLDEATSALDSESEVLIQDALWKLMDGKTAIIIAHRLSTIQKMDRIIVLENGKVIEQGSHNALIKQNGKYAELWKHQTGGFLED